LMPITAPRWFAAIIFAISIVFARSSARGTRWFSSPMR